MIVKTFFNVVIPHLKEFPSNKLLRIDEKNIRDVVLKKLNLRNENQLRDKFEGVQYYDKFLKIVGAKVSIFKILNLDSSYNKDINEINSTTNIKIFNREFKLNVFEFGELPMIYDYDDDIIFVLRKDKLTFLICGYCEKEFLVEYSIPFIHHNADLTARTYINFKEIKSILNLEIFKS